ncbi:MAG: hypothetical protein EOO24_23230 [Comamonadaceae bacterium]|nr:MAG: hypothetical protein EOO24_23230 [Comamonadaceae bacterium]
MAALLVGALCAQVWAIEKTIWFTVIGNPNAPDVDTVQVNPVAIASTPERKTMYVRVSRAAQRNNWEGVPYRSYESQVAFDCRARKASYLIASFYMAPLWAGDPHNTTDYTDKPRPMLFRDVEPNPTQRIVRAACRNSTGGNSNGTRAS